jgi:hypothetical protein
MWAIARQDLPRGVYDCLSWSHIVSTFMVNDVAYISN